MKTTIKIIILWLTALGLTWLQTLAAAINPNIGLLVLMFYSVLVGLFLIHISEG